MHAVRWPACLASMMLVALACGDSVPSPSAVQSDALTPLMSHGNAADHPAARSFTAPLSGAEEVPPAATDARGLARFHLTRSGDALEYRLIVANIENVTMAHIHLAPRGVNGPVAVWLYPGEPPPQLIEGRSDGVLATGTITAGDLVGPLAGGTLDDLLEQLNAGEAYVNVHTLQFPPGEVRGQIRAAGPGS